MNINIKSPIISLNVYDVKSPKEKERKVDGRHFHSLSYRKHGTIELTVNKKTFISKPGCITFIPKRQGYFTEVIEDTNMIVIHFDALDEDIANEPFVIENANQHLQQLFDLVLTSYSTENENNYECYSYFYKILAEIEKYFIKKSESKINPAVLKAKAEIEKNFTNPDFNINSLVAELPICSSHLRSEFKKSFSLSPIDYLKYVRLQNAISLLISNYYSIEEVALKSGYGSVSYFVQAFRKSTTYSPTKYREKFLTQEK